MIIQCEKTDFIKENDLIALTRDDKFIGYGTVITILSDCVLVEIDKKAGKSLNEIFYENIPFNFMFVNDSTHIDDNT